MENRMKILFICGFILLCLPQVLSLQESTQQYNKIFLNPFYRASMTNGANYTYNVSINPPDKVSSVTSAIISFDVYISPTVTFTLWVDNQACNNPTYVISTTFAGAGQSRITFDCSNVITKAGFYNIILRPTQQNTGTISGWVDLTYNNKPAGELKLHGTEYIVGDPAKVWLQLLETNQTPISNAVCYIDIYTPDAIEYVERALMTNMEHDGIYYYDLTAPSTIGVYPAIALCYYTAGQTYINTTSYKINNGAYVSGVIANTNVIDGVYLGWRENNTGGANRQFDVEFNFTNGVLCNISELLLTGVSFITTSRWQASGANDDTTMYVWNYTSSSWVTLPNKILEAGTGWKSVSNSFFTNNLTKLGIVNGSGTNIRFKFNNTNQTDGSSQTFDLDYLQVSCDQLTTPLAQQVMGSSEIHVSDPLNVTNISVSISSGIADAVWNYSNRSLTEFNFDVVNETEIALAVWNFNGTILSNILTQIAQTIWNYSDRNLTFFPTQTDLTNYTLISENVWNYLNRTLTDYNQSAQVDLTNYSLISEMVWNATQRTLTDFNFTVDVNLTAISDAVWNSVNRTLSDFNFTVEINNTLVAENVWSYFNRTLTDYNQTAQVDLTNYTLIEQLVWNATNRSLTEFNFDVVNESEIAQTVWDYFNRTLTDFNFTVEAIVNVSEIADAVWTNVNRTLTDYNQTAQLDLTNYTLIQELVWNATQRTLTEFNFTVEINNTELTSDIWNYYNRSLTYYDLGNNLDANDVWTYSNRTLTDYGNDITASDVWTYSNRTLTDFNFDLMNVTISVNNSEQLVNAITCEVNKLLKANNGEWIIDIEGC